MDKPKWNVVEISATHITTIVRIFRALAGLVLLWLLLLPLSSGVLPCLFSWYKYFSQLCGSTASNDTTYTSVQSHTGVTGSRLHTVGISLKSSHADTGFRAVYIINEWSRVWCATKTICMPVWILVSIIKWTAVNKQLHFRQAFSLWKLITIRADAVM